MRAPNALRAVEAAKFILRNVTDIQTNGRIYRYVTLAYLSLRYYNYSMPTRNGVPAMKIHWSLKGPLLFVLVSILAWPLWYWLYSETSWLACAVTALFGLVFAIPQYKPRKGDEA